MAQQVTAFNLPSDATVVVFSHMPYTQQITSLNQVCKSWHALLNTNKDALFWQPFYQEMSLQNVQPASPEELPVNYQAVVKAHFQENRENIEFIISLMQSDDQLTKCFHLEDCNLNAFKMKASIERFRLVWRALLQDATPVLVKLFRDLAKAQSNLFTDAIERAKNSQSLPKGEESASKILCSFKESEKYSPTIRSLIEKGHLPYDKAEVIHAMLPVIYTVDLAKPLLFNILKSREDLSKLRTMECNIHFPGASNAAMAIVQLCLDRGIYQQVTLLDLVRCKLIHQ